MQTLIPVVIILGVLGFILWKNWDKVKEVADKFKKPEAAKPEPVQGATKPEAPYKVPDVTPAITPPEISKPAVSIPQPTPEELHAQAQAVIARAYGVDAETARVLDERYERYQSGRAKSFDAAGMKKWDDQYPTVVPNILVPEVKGYRHVVNLDKGGINFLVFIPEPDKWDYLKISTDVVLWAGKFGNNAGHLVIRDDQRSVVDERRLGLEGIVCLFSSKDRKGYTKLDRGTYEVSISYVGADYPFVETYVDVIAK